VSRLAARAPTFTVHLGPADRRAALERDVREGLSASPRRLPPKWHYDERGSDLFEAITRLPEYYLTRRERTILEAHADEIASASRAETLVELGAGTSEKTRLLLDAFTAAGLLRRFVAVDVDEATLRRSAGRIARDYPGLEVHGVVGDIERHLHLLPRGARRMVAFLGSSIGNFDRAGRARLLGGLCSGLGPGESFLLGADLVKDASRLRAAYDDPAGVTRRFSLNILAVLNRELRADFDLESFEHVPRWDAEREWIDVRLRSLAGQTVTVADLGLEVRFEPGEELHTEISAKFRREGVERELAAAGLRPWGWWTDPDRDFGLSLSGVPGPA
jgi:L-histidine Nalpha-methyltransferase